MLLTLVSPFLVRCLRTWNPWGVAFPRRHIQRRKLPVVCRDVMGLEDRTLLSLTSVFEIDGNAQDGAGGGEDWQNPASALVTTDPLVLQDQETLPDTTYYDTGGSKDVNDLDEWAYDNGDVAPDKDEITNAGAAAYRDADGDLLVYFFADRFSNDGDAQIGFWFFRNDVTLSAPNQSGQGTFVLPDGSPATHEVGDILVLADFSQGGTQPTIRVLEWVGGMNGDDNGTAGGGMGPLDLLVSYAPTDPLPADPSAYARVNTTNQTAYWPYLSKDNIKVDTDGDGFDDYPIGTFFEGGVNLSNLLGADIGCFSSFLAETRTSTSTSAQLKDFVLGSFDLCGLGGSGQTPPCSEPGESVDYTITFENTGIATIYLDDITDPVLGNIVLNGVVQAANGTGVTAYSVPGADGFDDVAGGAFIDDGAFSLEPGEATTIHAFRTTQLENSVATSTTVRYNDNLALTGDSVETVIVGGLDVFAPAVQITKVADRAAATVGDTITYTYTITNMTDGDPSTVGIIDGTAPDLILALLSDSDGTIGDLMAEATAMGLDVLSLGESNSFTSTHLVTAADLIAGGPLSNTVTVNYSTSDPFSDCDAPPAQADASVDLVNAFIDIEGDGVNEVGAPHTFTVTVHQVINGVVSLATVGDVDVTLTDDNGAMSVINAAASTADDPGDNLDASGQATMVFTSNTAGTVAGHALVTLMIGGVTLMRETNGLETIPGSGHFNSDDVLKRFVDARLTLTPAEDANQVGNDHVITALLEIDNGDGLGFVLAPDNEIITFTIVSGPGSLSSVTCMTDGGDGNCTVTLSSAFTGLTQIDADWSGTIATVVMSRDATDVVKRWVDARLTLSPATDANQVGNDHVLTALLEIDYGDGAGFVTAPNGEIITFTIVSGPGSLDSATCVTDGGDGDCTVILSSAATGLTLIDADWSGGILTAEGTATAVADADDVLKRWVDAQLILSPTNATNPVGTNHVITAELNIDYGDGLGFVDAPAGETIMFTIVSGPGTLDSSTCVTGVGGTCTVTLTSNAPGLTTIDGDWTGTIITTEGSTIASTDAPDVTKLWIVVGKGLTPGYWKNHSSLWNQFADAVVAAMPADCDPGTEGIQGGMFITTTKFNTYFGLTSAQSKYSNNLTMLQALGLGSGNKKGDVGNADKLARHGVAGLLNFARFGSEYKLAGVTDFCDLYNKIRTAYLTRTFEPLATNVAKANEAGSLLLAANVGEGGQAADVTAKTLQSVVMQAIAEWRAEGIDPLVLKAAAHVPVQFRDLPGAQLGHAGEEGIWIDQDAAGWGWSTNPNASANHHDLLTVVTHELGHVIGFDHDDAEGGHHVMNATLTPGERRGPEAALGVNTIAMPLALPAFTAPTQVPFVTTKALPRVDQLTMSATQPQWLTLGVVSAPINAALPVARLATIPNDIEPISVQFSEGPQHHNLSVPVDDSDYAALNVLFDRSHLDSTLYWESAGQVAIATRSEPSDPSSTSAMLLTEEALESLTDDGSKGTEKPFTEESSICSTLGVESLLAVLSLAGGALWDHHHEERRSLWQRLFGRGKRSCKDSLATRS